MFFECFVKAFQRPSIATTGDCYYTADATSVFTTLTETYTFTTLSD